jgi:hypothetical protein
VTRSSNVSLHEAFHGLLTGGILVDLTFRKLTFTFVLERRGIHAVRAVRPDRCRAQVATEDISSLLSRFRTREPRVGNGSDGLMAVGTKSENWSRNQNQMQEGQQRVAGASGPPGPMERSTECQDSSLTSCLGQPAAARTPRSGVASGRGSHSAAAGAGSGAPLPPPGATAAGAARPRSRIRRAR